MSIKPAHKQTRWFSLPLSQNQEAAVPLYLAVLGSLCLEAIALWPQVSTGAALLLCSGWLVCTLLCLIGVIKYRRYRAAGWAVLVALLSPLVWLYLIISTALNPFSSEQAHGFPVFPWLFCQLPFAVIALWRSRWPRRVKVIVTVAVTAGLICLLTADKVRARLEVVGHRTLLTNTCIPFTRRMTPLPSGGWTAEELS